MFPNDCYPCPRPKQRSETATLVDRGATPRLSMNIRSETARTSFECPALQARLAGSAASGSVRRPATTVLVAPVRSTDAGWHSHCVEMPPGGESCRQRGADFRRPAPAASLCCRINGRTSVGPDGRVNRGGLRDSGQTNVAVSLRRDEPLIFCLQYSMQTALCERVVVVCRPDGCKRGTASLVSAERDGYIG